MNEGIFESFFVGYLQIQRLGILQMLHYKPTYIGTKHWWSELLPQLVVLLTLLVVFSLQGCFSSEASAPSQAVKVVPGNNSPTASFTSNCPNMDCSFDASASADSDGNIVNYSWDFGDGASGSGVMANHSYAVDGSYIVILTITDDGGSVSASTQSVTVVRINNPPTTSFASSCTDHDCSFNSSNSTDFDGTIISYNWDFGDATSGSGTMASHSYATDGSYVVILTVTDDDGAVSSSAQTVTVISVNNPPSASFTSNCPDLGCGFDARASTDSDGTIIDSSWDFGDGASGSGAEVNHSYAADGSFVVTLTVTDDWGVSSSSSQTVMVSVSGGGNNPPVASFMSNCLNLDCSFDASASADSDGNIVNYSWDFGDGTSGSGVMANHGYAVDGSYIVILTITDDGGSVSASTQTVSVVHVNNAPTVSFTSNCLFLNCSFDAGDSTDSDGTIVSYDWDFDDGTTGNAVTDDHDYAMDGTYRVMLTVTDNEGSTSSSSQTVTIMGINEPPIASFSSICTDLICSLDASTSSDSDGSIVSYSWDFGDAMSGSGAVVNHNYSADGSYIVILTVTDDGGSVSASTRNVTVPDSSGLNGQLLYENNCAACHGFDAQGDFASAIVGRTAPDITNAIKDEPQMTSLKSLSTEEIQLIADYLGTL